jgi:GDP-4-dehydro-6-deoxy-D-mannose reductase
MATILKMFLSLAKSHIDFRVVPEKIRPFDDPVYIGDNSRLRRLGWRPQIPLETTLKDMLDYWRNKFTLEESRRTEKQATGSGRR